VPGWPATTAPPIAASVQSNPSADNSEIGGKQQADDGLAELTPREREVLGLMAEGRTNAGIAKQLWLTEHTVETHVSSILGKLGLSQAPGGHRRVLAGLAYLRAPLA
jgi:DNA-binding NarL/FixJ family response regulator